MCTVLYHHTVLTIYNFLVIWLGNAFNRREEWALGHCLKVFWTPPSLGYFGHPKLEHVGLTRNPSLLSEFGTFWGDFFGTWKFSKFRVINLRNTNAKVYSSLYKEVYVSKSLKYFVLSVKTVKLKVLVAKTSKWKVTSLESNELQL